MSNKNAMGGTESDTVTKKQCMIKDVPEQKIQPAMQKLSEKKRIRKEKKCLNSNSLTRGKEKKRYEISLLV